MKNLFICIFVLCNCQLTIAQTLAIELSIDWKEQETFFNLGRLKNQTKANIPYLTIRYKNLTDESIYFFNGLNEVSDTLELWPFIMPQTHILRDLDIKTALKHSDTTLFFGNYNVFINERIGWFFAEKNKFSNHIIDSLKIHNLSQKIAYYEKEKMENPNNYSVDTLVEFLYYLQTIFYYQDIITRKYPNKQLLFFNNPNKKKISMEKARNILNKEDKKAMKQLVKQRRPYSDSEIAQGIIPVGIKNKLIFLRPQEEYTMHFNLISFYLLGGNFIFNMKWLKGTNKAFYLYYDKDGTTWHRDITMPEKLNGYKFFIGDVDIESVELNVK